MELRLIVTEHELRLALIDFLPMKLAIGSDTDPPWIWVDELEALEILPRRGVRLLCAGHRVHQRAWLRIDHFDVKRLPAFLGNEIVNKINDKLQQSAVATARNFSRTLTRSFASPARLSLVRQMTIGPPDGEVIVTEDAIEMRLTLPLAFGHEPEVAA